MAAEIRSVSQLIIDGENPMKLAIRTSLLAAAVCLTAGPALASSHNEVEVKGPIEAITSTSITVRQASFVIDPSTKFEDRNSRPADPALFVVGATVEVSAKISGTTLVAKDIELKSGSDSNNPPAGAPGIPSRSKAAARLLPLDPAVTSSASAGYKSESKRSRSEEKFSVNLKIKVPSSVPAAATIDEALALPLEAVLTRAGVEYARCSFDVSKIRARRRSAAVEYKIDLVERTTATASLFNEKKGQCDIDSATAGVQSGIPAVVTGDAITIQASLPGGAVSFLTGLFAASH